MKELVRGPFPKRQIAYLHIHSLEKKQVKLEKSALMDTMPKLIQKHPELDNGTVASYNSITTKIKELRNAAINETENTKSFELLNKEIQQRELAVEHLCEAEKENKLDLARSIRIELKVLENEFEKIINEKFPETKEEMPIKKTGFLKGYFNWLKNTNMKELFK